MHRRVALEVLAGRLALEACARRRRRSAGCRPSNGISSSLNACERLAGVGRPRARRARRARSSIASASFSSASARSPGVVFAHAVERRRGRPPRRGRRPPRSTAAPAAIASPVAGLRTALGLALGRVDALAVDEVLERVRCGRHRVRLLGGRFGRNVATRRAPDRPIHELAGCHRDQPRTRPVSGRTATVNADNRGRISVSSARLGLPNEGSRTSCRLSMRRVSPPFSPSSRCSPSPRPRSAPPSRPSAPSGDRPVAGDPRPVARGAQGRGPRQGVCAVARGLPRPLRVRRDPASPAQPEPRDRHGVQVRASCATTSATAPRSTISARYGRSCAPR